MARPSKLRENQWAEIRKQLLEGTESAASLARKYGVSKAAISAKCSKRIETVKKVANQIVETERSLSLLNVSEQVEAQTHAKRILALSEQLLGAAVQGAATGHRLKQIAALQLDKIDETNPFSEENLQIIRGIGVCQQVGNMALDPGLKILAVNKDSLREKDDSNSLEIVGGFPIA